jgi:hypothetical protein
MMTSPDFQNKVTEYIQELDKKLNCLEIAQHPFIKPNCLEKCLIGQFNINEMLKCHSQVPNIVASVYIDINMLCWPLFQIEEKCSVGQSITSLQGIYVDMKFLA